MTDTNELKEKISEKTIILSFLDIMIEKMSDTWPS